MTAEKSQSVTMTDAELEKLVTIALAEKAENHINENLGAIGVVQSADKKSVLLWLVDKDIEQAKLLIKQYISSRYAFTHFLNLGWQSLSAEQLVTLFSQKNDYAETALHWVVNQNYPELLTLVVKKLSPEQLVTLFSQKNNDGLTASHLLVADLSPVLLTPVVEKLSPEQLVTLFSQKNNNGQTALHLLVNRNNPELLTPVVEKLSAEQLVTLFSQQNIDGKSELFHGAANLAIRIMINTARSRSA